jgi:hypothetical protein
LRLNKVATRNIFEERKCGLVIFLPLLERGILQHVFVVEFLFLRRVLFLWRNSLIGCAAPVDFFYWRARKKELTKNLYRFIYIIYDSNLIQYFGIPLRGINMQRSIATLFLFSSLLLANSVYATTGVCLKGYGDTPEEAFKVGTNLLTAIEVGKEPLSANLQIRILPEKKKDLFTVLIYSIDKPTSCDLPEKQQTAEGKRANCTKDICSL